MKHFQSALFISILMFLVSCGGESDPKRITIDDVDTSVARDEMSEEMYEEVKKIYYSMPSPLELTTLIKSAGGEYRKDLTLNTKRVSDFQSTLKQGMALGVYGADLSYSSVFEQQQESLLFLAASKRLANSIGIHDAFSNNRIDRANNNLNNKDSMIAILSEVYWEINGQLKDENRNEIAMLVMCAGWLEGLYIGSQLCTDATTDELMVQRIMEQKFTAMQISEMFEQHRSDILLNEALPYFDSILEFYSGIAVDEEPSTMKQGTDGKYVIGGSKKIRYSIDDFNKIKQLALDSRTKIISN